MKLYYTIYDAGSYMIGVGPAKLLAVAPTPNDIEPIDGGVPQDEDLLQINYLEMFIFMGVALGSLLACFCFVKFK